MANFTLSGSKVETYFELTLQEMELEALYLMEKSELEIKKLMVQQGVSRTVATKAIIDLISNEEEFMSVWMNRNRRLIDEMHSQLVAQPIRVYGKQNKDEKFLWVLDSRAKHCGDCLDMAELNPMTISDWEFQGVGLPREGGTQCNVGCKCSLQAV